MEVTPGFRRMASPEPLPESDPVLVGRIRDEILASGPMTFARFMEIALYDPERGYYRAAEVRPGRAGDFLTAPELHPIFGRAVAHAVDEMWGALGRPAPFTLREYGAGSGTLAVTILDELRASGSPLHRSLRYEPVEIADRRRAELRERLATAGHEGRLAAGRHGGRLDDGRAPLGPPDAPIVGCVLANEFLDALPVHRWEQRDGRLHELYVDWRPDDDTGGGQFVDRPGPPSTPEIAERLAAEGIRPAEGQRGEVCLALEGWVAEVSRSLGRGYVLVIDYGHPAEVLYGSARRGGTLRAYVRHRVGADPYAHIGSQDLTAHVDITALLAAADREGLTTIAVTTQAEFLVGAGAGELLAAIQADPSTTLPEYLELRASLTRLVDPAAMGGFRVVALGRDVPADLAALSYRLRR